MKKIRPAILAMLLLVMVLSVTACGSSNNDTLLHIIYKSIDNALIGLCRTGHTALCPSGRGGC